MRANLPDYRTKEEEREWIERDPIVRFGHHVVDKKTLTPMRLKELEQAVELTLDEAVRFGTASPEPTVEMMEASVYAPHASWDEPKARGTRQLAINEALNEALHQEMARDSRVFVMGEDVGLIGGIFQVTKGLRDRFGEHRVRDTPISEATFVGAGVGAAVAGMRPVVEIQIWDFIAMTMDQVVNQAAKFRYMLGGTPTVPLVIRGPQGGGIRLAAQHSQSLEAWFTHVPGLVVIAPSTPYDAKGLLTAAIRDDNPVIFLEHKALYPVKGEVPEEPYAIPIGKADVKRAGRDVTVVATQAMVARALQAAGDLEKEGMSVEVIDPRTLAPLDEDDDPRIRRQDASARHRARGGQARRLRGRGRRHGLREGDGRAGRPDRPRRRPRRPDALQRQSRARDDSHQGGHRRRDPVPARVSPASIHPRPDAAGGAVVRMDAIPFDTTDWSAVKPTQHAGETGSATWRTREVGGIRVRMVEYSPGYRADHWCRKGHVLLVLEGELETELEDGRRFLLRPGMTYQVADAHEAHRSSTRTGARLFIVD